MLKKNVLGFCGLIAACVALTGCNKIKSHPVTWEDIAQTIPGNPAYVVAVNVAFEADSALNKIWAKEDVRSLISQGLALDTVKPTHFVVVATEKATFVTWPLPDPLVVGENVSDWPTASLNNTVDAHIKVQGKASLVLSSTQAWVVNNVHGEKFVNELLSAAMNTKAAHVVPFAECITTPPAAVNGVVPYEGRYYAIELNHEDGLMRVDVNAYDKLNRRLDIVDGLGRLPLEYIDQASPVSPFAAIQVDDGTVPSLMVRLAKISGDEALVAGAAVMGPLFGDVSGTIVAHWNEKKLFVKVPYVSETSAHVASRQIKKIIKKHDYKIEVREHKDTLIFETGLDYKLPKLVDGHRTPHRHSQTENPSAIAYAVMEPAKHERIEAYFELAPTHARLQIDFHEDAVELADVTELIKTLIFRTL